MLSEWESGLWSYNSRSIAYAGTLQTKVAHWGVTKVRGECMTAVMKSYLISCQKMMFKWSFLPFSILLWCLNTSNMIYMDVKCHLKLSCHCIWNQALRCSLCICSLFYCGNSCVHEIQVFYKSVKSKLTKLMHLCESVATSEEKWKTYSFCINPMVWTHK